MTSRPAPSLPVAAVCAAAALVLTACTAGSSSTNSTPSIVSSTSSTPVAVVVTSPPAPTSASLPTSPTATATKSTSVTPTPTKPAGSTPAQLAAAAAAVKARAEIKPLAQLLGKGGISIEAVNTDTGATFTYGAKGGMRTGSIIKLYILETLLLQHQDAGTSMSGYQKAVATKMIENSDNDAAQTLFDAVGRGAGMDRVKKRLNINNTHVDSDHYGLTTTCASDYIALLRGANSAKSPLHESARDYIRHLQANIEADQTWGVSAAADKGTTTYLKNGWLEVDDDGGLWLMNSVGDVTVNGHVCYLAVLTQHEPPAYAEETYEKGQTRVEKLVKIAAAVVAPK